MTIVDNKLEVAKIRLTYIITISACIILVLYSVFARGQSEGKIYSLILGTLFCLAFLYLIIIKPEYIYFSIETNKKLVVRNYTAFPLFRKYKAFEIPLASMYDFEIKKAFFNRLVFMRIHIKTNNKIGKYPWLSLSALPAKDRKKLVDNLNKLISADKRKK